MEKVDLTQRESDKSVERQLEEIFPKKDREAARAGLIKLAEHLLALPPNELPEIALFPDTSARPLAFAVNPVLKAIYQAKSLKNPPCAFINLSKGDGMYLFKILRRLSTGERKDVDDLSPGLQKDVELAHQSRQNVYDRVDELKVATGLRDDSKILIVDDASNTRKTLSLLNEFITARLPQCRITNFVFFDSPFEDTRTSAWTKEERTDFDSKHELIIGSTRVNQTFAYRDFDNKDKEGNIGWTKSVEDVHAKPSVNLNSPYFAKLIHRLRQELEKVGKEVAETLKLKTDEK